MSGPGAALQAEPRWDDGATSRVPFSVYTSDALHRKELKRFFYKGHWCYVGLEAEIPLRGSFTRERLWHPRDLVP